MGVGAGLYMCDVVKKVHVRYLISWWVLVLLCARLWRVDCVMRRVSDELTGDELTVWRHDRVTSWLVAIQDDLCVKREKETTEISAPFCQISQVTHRKTGDSLTTVCARNWWQCTITVMKWLRNHQDCSAILRLRNRQFPCFFSFMPTKDLAPFSITYIAYPTKTLF